MGFRRFVRSAFAAGVAIAAAAAPEGVSAMQSEKTVVTVLNGLEITLDAGTGAIRYFTEGTLIGNCLVPQVRPGVRLAGYVLPDRVLALVLNHGPEESLDVPYDLEPRVGAGEYTLTATSESGQSTPAGAVPARGATKTAVLKPLEIVALEFVRR